MAEFVIREYSISDLSRVVEIHKSSLPEDFLPLLGSKFLINIFYPAVSKSQNARIFVVFHNDLVVGFAILSLNSGKLLKEIVFYQPFKFICLSISSVIFSLTQLRMALGILWSSLSIKDENDFSEIYIIAVDQTYRSQGIGQMLVNKSIEFVKTRNLKGIKIKTLKTNKSWISFFEKNSWKETCEFRIAGKDYVILSMSIKGIPAKN